MYSKYPSNVYTVPLDEAVSARMQKKRAGAAQQRPLIRIVQIDVRPVALIDMISRPKRRQR